MNRHIIVRWTEGAPEEISNLWPHQGTKKVPIDEISFPAQRRFAASISERGRLAGAEVTLGYGEDNGAKYQWARFSLAAEVAA
jgi:hypothetical protein